jgi:hypothetical protein
MGAAPSMARSISAARSRIETTSLSGSAVTPSVANSSGVSGANSSILIGSPSPASACPAEGRPVARGVRATGLPPRSHVRASRPGVTNDVCHWRGPVPPGRLPGIERVRRLRVGFRAAWISVCTRSRHVGNMRF